MRDPEIEFAPSPRLREFCRLVARLVSRAFWRIEFHDTENIPPAGAGGFVIASNHPTYFDPVWVSIPVRHDIRYLAWDAAFGWPVIGFVIRRLGAMPVRIERGSSPGTLKKAMAAVKRGAALMVFPEGSREFSEGELLSFRTGAAQISIKTGVPILPVTIVGGNRVWPRGFRVPRPGKVRIYFHPLITPLNGDGRARSPKEITGMLENSIGIVLERAV